MKDINAKVLSSDTLAEGLIRIILHAPEIACEAKAGQFIHMLVPDNAHVLRRPISLMAMDANAGTLTLAIQPKGRGTQMVCNLKEGDTVEISQSTVNNGLYTIKSIMGTVLQLTVICF